MKGKREAAHFLGCDALVVPSARWPEQNLVVIPANPGSGKLKHITDHGRQDLKAWGRLQGC